MTALLITVDTELSSLLHERGMSLEDNVRSSIWGEAEGGAYGVGWQMDELEKNGLKGVFFVETSATLTKLTRRHCCVGASSGWRTPEHPLSRPSEQAISAPMTIACGRSRRSA